MQIEIAATSDLICKKIASGEIQLFETAVSETLIENFVRMFLDGKARILEKTEILDLMRVVEINENGYPFGRIGLKDCTQQARQVKRREGFRDSEVCYSGHKEAFFSAWVYFNNERDKRQSK